MAYLMKEAGEDFAIYGISQSMTQDLLWCSTGVQCVYELSAF